MGNIKFLKRRAVRLIPSQIQPGNRMDAVLIATTSLRTTRSYARHGEKKLQQEKNDDWVLCNICRARRAIIFMPYMPACFVRISQGEPRDV